MKVTIHKDDKEFTVNNVSTIHDLEDEVSFVFESESDKNDAVVILLENNFKCSHLGFHIVYCEKPAKLILE